VNVLAETIAWSEVPTPPRLERRRTRSSRVAGDVCRRVEGRSGTSAFYHADALGAISRLTAASQNVTAVYVLAAWGQPVASSGSTTNPFRYVGSLGYYTEPDLGLDNVRARWLRPATGSWVSVDPVEGEARYGYVGGRATRAVDASGLWWPNNYGPGYTGIPMPPPTPSPAQTPTGLGVGIGWELCFGIGHGEELIWCHDEWGRWRCYPWSKDIVGPPSASMGLVCIKGLDRPSDYGGPFGEVSITPLPDIPVYGSVAVAPSGVVSMSTGLGVGPVYGGQQSVYYPPDEHWTAGPVIRRIEREEQRVLDRAGFPGGPRYAPPPRLWPPWADWLWPWR